MLAQEAATDVIPQATDSSFGLWQILALVGIVVILVGYKLWKNKTMS